MTLLQDSTGNLNLTSENSIDKNLVLLENKNENLSRPTTPKPFNCRVIIIN